jgi:hypothetical protein
MDRFLALLRERGSAGATTLEIVQHARVMAVSAIASEARAMGYRIDCEEEPRAEDGAKRFRYRLVSEPHWAVFAPAAKGGALTLSELGRRKDVVDIGSGEGA